MKRSYSGSEIMLCLCMYAKYDSEAGGKNSAKNGFLSFVQHVAQEGNNFLMPRPSIFIQVKV